MNREGKKCVLYPRVSTEMQVDGYTEAEEEPERLPEQLRNGRS